MNFLFAVTLIASFLLLLAASTSSPSLSPSMPSLQPSTQSMPPSMPSMPPSTPSMPPSTPSLPPPPPGLTPPSPRLTPPWPPLSPPPQVLPPPPQALTPPSPQLTPPSPPLPPTSSSPGCSDDLLAFSSCLSYVSAPPNDITDTPTPPCCVAFSAVFNSSERDCFCYLLKQPSLFGFPLNQSRLLSLPQICNPASLSLESVCSGSTMAALPPLRSTTDSSPIGSSFLVPTDNFTSLTPAETTVGSPEELTAPLPPLPADPSSALKKMGYSYSWFASGAVTFLGVVCAS